MKFVLSTSFVSIKDIPKLAVACDKAGWHGISFSDHVVHPKQLKKADYPYTKTGERRWDAFTEWPDPMVMIGALSSITNTIEFMNNIYVLPMRNPFFAAKAIATAAVLSSNRVNLCIGVGWSKDEFELLEQDFHTRGKRCDEAITVMKKLWHDGYTPDADGWVSHDGEFYPFAPLEMSPTPSAHIPIWVGGISKAALKRAARIGDGWVSDLQSSQDIVQSIATIHEMRKELGRDHLPFSVMATPNDAFMPEQYQALAAAGVTHIMTQPWFFYGQGPYSLEQQLQAIERYAEDTIAASQ